MPIPQTADEKQGVSEVLSGVRQTLADKLPRLASTAAKGLVPLSLALGLLPVLQAPDTIFYYLAGLAPNFISDMLLDMRAGNRKPDVEALAEAITARLDDPGVRQLADELQVVTGIVATLKAHNEQLGALTRTLREELAARHWLVPAETHRMLGDLIAQGEYIAQAQDHSTAIVVGPGATLNYAPAAPRERYLRILVGGTSDVLTQREAVRQAVAHLHEPTLPEIEVVHAQAVEPREADRALATCDAYVGLLGARYGEPVIDGKSITHFEIERAHQLHKPVRLYRLLLPEEELDPAQVALLTQLIQEHDWLVTFSPLDTTAALSAQIEQHLREWLSGSTAPQPRLRPTSGRRGLIAPLGRSPGAVTGLYHALRQSGVTIDYVRTLSTSEPQVERAVKVVQDELELQGLLDYEDAAIPATDFQNDGDVMAFKAACVRLLNGARVRGDAVAISITGGRTVMGALVALVAQLDAPDDSVLYQFSVPDSIEEDGRLPNFSNQRPERKQQILRPKAAFPESCHLVAVPFSHLFNTPEAS